MLAHLSLVGLTLFRATLVFIARFKQLADLLSLHLLTLNVIQLLKSLE